MNECNRIWKHARAGRRAACVIPRLVLSIWLSLNMLEIYHMSLKKVSLINHTVCSQICSQDSVGGILKKLVSLWGRWSRSVKVPSKSGTINWIALPLSPSYQAGYARQGILYANPTRQASGSVRGHVHMMSAWGGGRGYPKSRCSKEA